MSANTLQLTALILMLITYPLISFGTEGGLSWMTWTALALLAVGGAVPVVMRFTRKEDK